MTILELLAQYEIHRPRDLMEAIGCARSYAGAVFAGRRGLGRQMMLKLYERKGIPLEALIMAARLPKPPSGGTRGRPRKPATNTRKPRP
jgi:hypothetical protein